jgi:hypothetical protein
MLEQVIIQLFSNGIIDETTKTKMDNIKTMRNSFIHDEYSVKLPSKIVRQVIASARDIINCTALIKSEYDKWSLSMTEK